MEVNDVAEVLTGPDGYAIRYTDHLCGCGNSQVEKWVTADDNWQAVPSTPGPTTIPYKYMGTTPPLAWTYAKGVWTSPPLTTVAATAAARYPSYTVNATVNVSVTTALIAGIISYDEARERLGYGS